VSDSINKEDLPSKDLLDEGLELGDDHLHLPLLTPGGPSIPGLLTHGSHVGEPLVVALSLSSGPSTMTHPPTVGLRMTNEAPGRWVSNGDTTSIR
jgi:hypothetical protein